MAALSVVNSCNLPSCRQRSSLTSRPPPSTPPFQMVAFVLLLLLHICWAQSAAAAPPPPSSSLPPPSPPPREIVNQLIQELLHSIKKASNFFNNHQNDINVDGLFGMQSGQGQLLSIHEMLSKKKNDGVDEKVGEILSKMGTVIQSVLGRNQKYEASYTERFMPMVDEPFIAPWVPHWLNVRHKPITFEKLMVYDEEFGDVCLTQVLGSCIEKTSGKQLPKCSVTSKCLDFMTKPNTTGYYLSHQLLYIICLQMNNCSVRAGFEKFQKQPTVSAIQRQLCAKMYNEADQLSNNGYVDTIHQDLFAEYNFLCAQYGFQNFLRVDWIKMVLRWQSSSGCFTEKTMDKSASTSRSSPTMRKLMRELVMKDGCLSHKSGLCYGLMTIYLKGLLHWQLSHHS